MPVLLVALDFDGVLAPIVQDPSTSRPLPGSATAVHGLADLPATTVAMLSGRALHDLRTVSGFATPVRLVGSHGGEFDDGALELTDAQRALKDELAAAVRGVVDGEPGVRLENKPAGIVVHVRGADPAIAERVLDAVRTGPAALPGVESTRRQGRAGDGGGAGQQRCGDRHAARTPGGRRRAVRRRRRHGRDGVRPAAAGGRRGEGGRGRDGGGVPGQRAGGRHRGAGGPARRATGARSRVRACACPARQSPARTSAARRGGRSSCARPGVRSAT